MHRLSYHSEALITGLAALNALYAQAASYNADAGITGALLFADGRFAQVLEGSRAAITSLYERITRDPRHEHVTLDYLIETDGRLFPDWSMGRITDDNKADIPLARILTAVIAADSDTSIRQLRSLARAARSPVTGASHEEHPGIPPQDAGSPQPATSSPHERLQPRLPHSTCRKRPRGVLREPAGGLPAGSARRRSWNGSRHPRPAPGAASLLSQDAVAPVLPVCWKPPRPRLVVPLC